MAANLTQIFNFKANFHQEFELFSKNKIYANNGGHFKIGSIIIKKNLSPWDLIISRNSQFHFQLSSGVRASLITYSQIG